MQAKPRATKASMIDSDVASSAVQPKTLPPRTMGAKERPELPRVRCCMEEPCAKGQDRRTRSRSMDSRAPRQVVGQNIDRNRRQKQQNADPEQRRMMNAPPIASACRGLCRVSMMMFFIHRGPISSAVNCDQADEAGALCTAGSAHHRKNSSVTRMNTGRSTAPDQSI